MATDSSVTAAGLDGLLARMRPRLHRYCARMTGSVIDGEDVLQDAVIKALESFATAAPLENPQAWLFRIAHTTALDFLRRRRREGAAPSPEELEMIADPTDAVTSRQIASASLRTFMRLPVAQRASVILTDVLGHSLHEACAAMDFTLPALKAALHRGRARLRDLANEPDDRAPARLSEAERERLGAYVAHFNARDFDAIRAMISDDVRLDLVNQTRIKGKAEVSRYFGNYARHTDWRLVVGLLEDRPAILVFDPARPDAGPRYFMLLQWEAGMVAGIRDFRHAAYVVDGAEYRI